MSEEKKEFHYKPGDIVTLKSGGTLMTVINTKIDRRDSEFGIGPVKCLYTDSKGDLRDIYLEEEVLKYSDASSFMLNSGTETSL